MKKKRLSLTQLAAQTNRTVDEVRTALIDGGINIAEATDTLRGRHRFRARRLLGIVPKDDLVVSVLAKQAGMAEAIARNLLHAKGVLHKRRLKRIPAGSLPAAKRVLGIEKATTEPGQIPSSELPRPRKKKKKVRRKTKVRRETNAWRIIGRTEDLVLLSVSDVEKIHHILVKDFATTNDPIVPYGVRDRSLLESAVFRPHTSNGGELKYPTQSMSSAALLHSLVQDHPFFNGNKRTALVSMLVLLDNNGWVCTSNQSNLYDFVIALGAHSLIEGKTADNKPSADDEVMAVAKWLQRNIRKIGRAEQPIKFRDLRKILNSYGCKLEHPKGVGNRINITRGSRSTQVAYKNEGHDVSRNTVHKIRRELGLDERSGYDSIIFYGGEPRISRFINKYRSVLDRLAKV